ncbi:MAG: hypothetical protein R3E89_14400 [Thiolinea sp.]
MFFDPQQTRAAIVTCGGLCPGLNAVIRGLVMQFGMFTVAGISRALRYGYQGLGRQGQEPLELTPARVSDIMSRRHPAGFVTRHATDSGAGGQPAGTRHRHAVCDRR